MRDVELILAERGITVTHKSIRQWCHTFGGEFARKLRRCRPKPGDTWHLDEVFLKIDGELHYLWRAVDQHGVVLDILVQNRRNATSAKRFFERLLVGLKYKPKRIVTDGLRSYGVAHRDRAVQRYAESVVSPGCNRFGQNGSGGRELGFPNRRNSDP